MPIRGILKVLIINYFMYINENIVGLVFGAFVGGVNAIWALLVFLGWAQPFMNFIFWAHMIALPYPYVVGAFDISTAAILVVFAFVIGYVVGNIIARIWNTIHK